jgi:hypothetical protein
MKYPIFTETQRLKLQYLLSERLKSYDVTDNDESNPAKFKRFYSYYVGPTRSALDKITNTESVVYSDKEKLSCIGCIHEQYNRTLDQLKLKSTLDWLDVSDAQRKVVADLDDCKEILKNFGYFKTKNIFQEIDPDFSYGAVLKVSDKLKKSDLVFLSKTAQNEYYKIAFVHNSEEYLSIELPHKISWRNLAFVGFGNTTIEEIASTKFSFMTTKPEARELLSVFKPKYYFEETKDTVNFLLN